MAAKEYKSRYITVPNDAHMVGLPKGKLQIDLADGETYHEAIQGSVGVNLRKIEDIAGDYDAKNVVMESVGLLLDQPARLDIEDESFYLDSGYTILGNLKYRNFDLVTSYPTDARFITSVEEYVELGFDTPFTLQRGVDGDLIVKSASDLLDWQTSHYLEQSSFGALSANESTESVNVAGYDRVSLRVAVDAGSANKVDVRLKGRMGTTSNFEYINDQTETISPGNVGTIHVTQNPWYELQVETVATNNSDYTLNGNKTDLIAIREA